MQDNSKSIPEIFLFDNDIRIICQTAKSFPAGIAEAHQTLHKIVPHSINRKYFGVSRPEKDRGIVYHAAAEELSPNEGEKLNCDTLVLKKGKYISLFLTDYLKDIPGIGIAFEELLAYPGIDPQGYCVEMYLNEKDMRCVVRLKD